MTVAKWKCNDCRRIHSTTTHDDVPWNQPDKMTCIPYRCYTVCPDCDKETIHTVDKVYNPGCIIVGVEEIC